uniref:S100/CaBP-9k-type calcium binding subdomain domain-containing protein n=1 Tax=Callorhinchus milii TaxID=7868 RepID=A0A4W3IJ53_CALMI
MGEGELDGPWMSELENALISIMKIFHKYSGSTTGKLKKAQVKELVNNELSRFIEELLPPEKRSANRLTTGFLLTAGKQRRVE